MLITLAEAENAEDICAEAVQINEERAGQEAAHRTGATHFGKTRIRKC